ncbi:MAG: GNAT family N-acetyltransferase [Solirubrobacteraceae bacterium]
MATAVPAGKAAGVEVRPVSGARDLRRFIDLPYRLHARHPMWVPPLKLERRLFLNRRLNPFFSHGDGEYFIAVRDGAVVGRITAHINHAYNDFHGTKWGWFGFLEFEQDATVLSALIAAAEAWLRPRGCEKLVGPADFTMNEESGILIDGFDVEPMIKQPWHPPYYQRLLEEVGLRKAIDLYMWHLQIADRSGVLPIIWELAEKVEPKHHISVRPMKRTRLRKDIDAFAEVYNSAWSKNWDFVPYSKKDLDAYAFDLHLAFDKNWFMLAESEADGEVIAAAITVPDLNQVLAKMRGKLLPLGWWHFLNRRRIMTRVRVGFLGVKPEYQHTGVAALLYKVHFDAAERTPQTWGEMGWILESNKSMNRGMEAMGGRIVKRYRVYERELS